MRVEAAEPGDFAWLQQRVGCALTPDVRGIRAVDACGLVRGVILYDLWTDNSVQAHMAVDTPIAWRSLLPACFAYPFNECGKGVLLATVRGDNSKSARLIGKFGFEPVAVIQDGAAKGVPLVTFQMRRENCKWLRAERRVGRVAGRVTALWTHDSNRGLSSSGTQNQRPYCRPLPASSAEGT